jgi:hypothetical protein
MYSITHFTRVPSSDGWDHVLYFRYIGAPPSGSISEKNFNRKGDLGGYVYVFTNEAYPSKVKIGMTTSTPERRLKSVNGSGVVDNWEVADYFHCLRPWDLEQAIHIKLDSIRSRNDREFFEMSVVEAMDVIREIGENYGPL